MWPRVRDQRIFLGVMAGLIGLAWISLWMWKQSPYGRFLSHHENESVLGHDSNYALVVVLFAAGWTLMTIAMMLPTTLPLLGSFQRLVAARRDRVQLLALVIGGYLLVWLAFGIVAHAFDLALHRGLDRNAWMLSNTWVFGAGPLLLAGAFQFTRLKYRCLDKCRTPVSFVVQHWHGGEPRAQALRLGIHHGAFCVGCCWALMLLMFAVGTGNLGWMLLLGGVMAIEKNAPWGRKFSAPLGVALLVWGSLIVLGHTVG